MQMSYEQCKEKRPKRKTFNLNNKKQLKKRKKN